MRMLLLNPVRILQSSLFLSNSLGRNLQPGAFIRFASTNDHRKNDDEDPWANVKIVEHRRPKYDDMPIPQGSWKESYDKKQRSYNWQLGLSVAFFGGTLLYVWQKDPFDFEKVFGPYKYMRNPPAFESPVLEPNILEITKAQLEKEFGANATESVVSQQSRELSPAEVSDKKKLKMDQSSTSSLPERTQKEISHIDINKLPDIPNHVPYLIVGGGTAAFAAFRSIRANNPKAAVLVVTQEPYNPYMRPPLTKELWFSDEARAKIFRFKQFTGKERSVFFENDEFYVDPRTLSINEDGGVAVLRDRKVIRIDPDQQKVRLDNGWEIFYDRCLLATGATPRSLPVLNAGGKDVTDRITLFRGLSDFVRLEEMANTAKSIVIIGGGFLGSEIACSLARRGKLSGTEVHQVFPEKGNLGRILPEYLSGWLTRKVQKVDGIHVYPEAFVKKASFSNGQVLLHLSNDNQISADHVVVAVGVTPNTELAASAQIEVDDVVGGFKVNSELEARKNIWVAGDAASFFDMILGRRRIEHHDHAVATGRLAGENMLGKGKPFWHQSMFWSDIGPEIGFEAVGLVDSSLETVAVFARTSDGKLAESKSSSDAPASYGNLEVPDTEAEYSKGVVFYLQNKVVVGILLWNVFNHISVARKIIKDQRSFADLSEVAKLFNLHDNGDSPEVEKSDSRSKDKPKDDTVVPQNSGKTEKVHGSSQAA